MARRVFSKEFKQEAVQLSVQSDKSLAEVAKELGISASTLDKWRRAFLNDPQRRNASNKGDLSELELENMRLKKENKRLEMEHSILKKAAAFFAKESL